MGERWKAEAQVLSHGVALSKGKEIDKTPLIVAI